MPRKLRLPGEFRNSLRQGLSGAEQAAEKGLFPKEKCEKHASGPEGHIHFMPLIPGINPRPTARRSFSAAFKALVDFAAFAARLKSCADTCRGFAGVFPQPVKPLCILRDVRHE